MNLPFGIRKWSLALLGCMIAVAISFSAIDVPLAAHLQGGARHFRLLERIFGSAILLSVEVATIMELVLARFLRGTISRFGKVLGLACITSLCCYAINARILKVVFGIPNPGRVFHGAEHVFHWLVGSEQSSFPSGHMVLTASFAGVFMRLYPASVRPLSCLLAVTATLLLIGDWHFLSDLIAGTFLGGSAGFVVGGLWQPI